jgi:hypothetical protein
MQIFDLRSLTGAVAALAIIAATGTAAAQDTGGYAAIGGGYASSNADRIEPVATDAGLVQVRAGYGLHRYFAAEVDASFAVVKGDFDPAGVTAPDAALTLDRSFAGYLVARYPATDRLTVFARGGYHHTRLRLRAAGFDQAASFDNYAFGGGASYDWGRNGVRVDYTNLRTNLNGDSIDHRILGLSLVRRF